MILAKARGCVYIFAVDVDVLYLPSRRIYEVDLLPNVHAVMIELFPEPPHVTPPKVLVLEDDFNVIRSHP